MTKPRATGGRAGFVRWLGGGCDRWLGGGGLPVAEAELLRLAGGGDEQLAALVPQLLRVRPGVGGLGDAVALPGRADDAGLGEQFADEVLDALTQLRLVGGCGVGGLGGVLLGLGGGRVVLG